MKNEKGNIDALTNFIISKHLRTIQEIAQNNSSAQEKNEHKKQLTSILLEDLYRYHLEMIKQEHANGTDDIEDLEVAINKMETDKETVPILKEKEVKGIRKLQQPLYTQFKEKEPESYIVCQICGGKYKHLANHLYKYHKVTPEEYKIDFPETTYFISEELRVQNSELNEKYISDNDSLISDAEIEFIKKNFTKMKNSEIAEALNITVPILANIINKYIPQKKINQRSWTEEEIHYLQKNYKTTSIKEMARTLGRSSDSIKNKAFMFNLRKEDPGMVWTKEEESYLVKNYTKCTYVELAAYFGRSIDSVRSKLERLKLFRKRANHPWTTEEEDFIIKNYHAQTAEELARHIECTVIAVRKKIQKLGLKKT